MSFPLINPTSTFLDSSGAPLASGTIEFRDPTSNDLIDSFPTADDADAQTNANANPLTLNARGEATGLYLEDGAKYKIILKDSAGATVWTQDDVICPVNRWGSQQTADESAASVTPTDYTYEPGDVRRYGAALDGVTDDGGAVGRWLDVGLQGRKLIHPGGNCKVTTWTTKSLTSDIYIYGASDAEITGVTGEDFVKPEGGGIYVEGVEFDTWQSLIKNANTDSGTTPFIDLVSCIIRNCSANGIDHERPINRFSLRNVQMYGMVNYAVRVGRNTYAEQDNWKNFQLTDVYIEDSTAASSTDAAGFVLYGKNLQASNIHIGTITSVSGACWGFYTKVRYAQVSNIIVDDVSTTSATDVAGINIKGSKKGETTSPQGFTYLLDGATVVSSDGDGIKCQQQDVLLSNIHIEEFGIDGIKIDDPDSPNVTLTNFKIFTATSGTKVGVRVTNDVGFISVEDGIIDGPSLGVRLAASSGGGVGFRFDGINIDNCTTGMQINTGASLDQVKIRDIYTGSGCTTGFITSGAGTVTNLQAVDCDFTDASTPATIGGTLTTPKFRRVRGYVTDNSGSSSIATGATISHGLASTPDTVTVTAGASGMTDLTVTSVGATTFVVNFGGGGTNTVYWRASMDEAR